MPTGDVWGDAQVVPVYWYLRSGYAHHIPDSWVSALNKFDADLIALGLGPH